jgi:hypothetical protein
VLYKYSIVTCRSHLKGLLSNVYCVFGLNSKSEWPVRLKKDKKKHVIRDKTEQSMELKSNVCSVCTKSRSPELAPCSVGQHYTVTQPRRPRLESSPPWKPQILIYTYLPIYEGRLKSSWTGGIAPLLCCYASFCIRAAHCRQSTKFSNGPRSYSAILKRVLLKRP